MFEQTINTRLAQLGVKGGEVCEALGISWAAWSTMRRRSNLQFESLQKLALLLALPVEVLASRDAGQAASEPVPDWRHLDAVRDWIAQAKHNDNPTVPEWHEFAEIMASRYPKEPTNG